MLHMHGEGAVPRKRGLVLGHMQGIGPVGLLLHLWASLLAIGPWIRLKTWVLGLEPNEKNDTINNNMT